MAFAAIPITMNVDELFQVGPISGTFSRLPAHYLTKPFQKSGLPSKRKLEPVRDPSKFNSSEVLTGVFLHLH